MDVDIRQDCSSVDWQTVSNILKDVGMAHHEPDMHRRAFEGSHTTVFVYLTGRLIGFGRAISDGVVRNSRAGESEKPSWRPSCPGFRIATPFYMRPPAKKGFTGPMDSGR